MMLVVNSFLLKKEIATGLGFYNMLFFSMGSFSKIIEQVGPIINSRKITCTGERIFG